MDVDREVSFSGASGGGAAMKRAATSVVAMAAMADHMRRERNRAAVGWPDNLAAWLSDRADRQTLSLTDCLTICDGAPCVDGRTDRQKDRRCSLHVRQRHETNGLLAG
jgi:hypothetical protein